MASMIFRIGDGDEGEAEIYATEKDEVAFLIHGEAAYLSPLEARQLVRVIEAAIEAAEGDPCA